MNFYFYLLHLFLNFFCLFFVICSKLLQQFQFVMNFGKELFSWAESCKMLRYVRSAEHINILFLVHVFLFSFSTPIFFDFSSFVFDFSHYFFFYFFFIFLFDFFLLFFFKILNDVGVDESTVVQVFLRPIKVETVQISKS